MPGALIRSVCIAAVIGIAPPALAESHSKPSVFSKCFSWMSCAKKTGAADDTQSIDDGVSEVLSRAPGTEATAINAANSVAVNTALKEERRKQSMSGGDRPVLRDEAGNEVRLREGASSHQGIDPDKDASDFGFFQDYDDISKRGTKRGGR